MRVIFIPPSQKVWDEFFKIHQIGHGMVGFKGSAYQRGAGIGNLLGGLLRSFLPVAKSIGKSVGRQALRTGVEVASDALSGENIGQSIRNRGKAGANKLLTKGVRKLENLQAKTKKRKTGQKGHGLGFRPKTKSTLGSVKTVKQKKAVGKRRRVTRKNRLRSDQLGVYIA